MQVTKGTWHMHEQCVPGSLSSSPAQEPGNEASYTITRASHCFDLVIEDYLGYIVMVEMPGT